MSRPLLLVSNRIHSAAVLNNLAWIISNWRAC